MRYDYLWFTVTCSLRSKENVGFGASFWSGQNFGSGEDFWPEAKNITFDQKHILCWEQVLVPDKILAWEQIMGMKQRL